MTGVCQSQVNGSGDRSFQLLFDSPPDIRVLDVTFLVDRQAFGLDARGHLNRLLFGTCLASSYFPKPTRNLEQQNWS